MTALEISKTIFYSPATNGKAEESIENGRKLIEHYASLSPRGQMKWVRASELPKGQDGYYLHLKILPKEGTVPFDGFGRREEAGLWKDEVSGNYYSNDEVKFLDESPSDQSGQIREALEKILAYEQSPLAADDCYGEIIGIARTALDSLPGEGGDGKNGGPEFDKTIIERSI